MVTCACPVWVAPRPVSVPDPRTDRDLFLAWVGAVEEVGQGQAEIGYEIMMCAVEAWVERLATAETH